MPDCLFILAVERSQCSVIPGSLRHPIYSFPNPNDLTLTSDSSVPGLLIYADSQRLRSRRPSLGGEDDSHRQRLEFGRCVWLEESGEEDITAREVRVYLAGKTWLWPHGVAQRG